MRGLILKSLRETWGGLLITSIALFAFVSLLTLILPQILETVGEAMLNLAFARRMLSSLLGIEIEDEITAQMLQAIVWVHPAVLALIWAFEITFCTRTPTAEIDRGTIDFLLGLPISRRAISIAESLVWLGAGLLLMLVAGVAHLTMASSISPEFRPGPKEVALVLANFYCLYIAAGGVAYLVSSMSDRRIRAVLLTLAVLLASFLLNFLAQAWPPATSISFLGVLNYYQPAAIIRSGTLPIGDLAVLLGVGLVTWTAGLEITARRSMCTV